MGVLKFLGKVIGVTVVVILILALILVGVSAITTPSTFGLENMEINGVSIEDQGLADTTFYNIGKIVLGILVVEEEESVSEDAYSQVVEKLPTVSSSENSTSDTGNDITFDNLLDGKLYFEEEVEVSVESNEMSAILNMVMNGDALSAFDSLDLYLASDYDGVVLLSSVENGLDVKVNLSDIEEEFEISQAELIEMLQEYDCEFISVNPTSDSSYIYLETKFKLTLPEELTSEINDLGVITISNNIYITFKSVYRLEDGELVVVKASDNTMSLNSLSIESTETIATSMCSILAGESVDGEEVLVYYNNALSSMMATIFNNIGEIQGVENGALIIKTRTE